MKQSLIHIWQGLFEKVFRGSLRRYTISFLELLEPDTKKKVYAEINRYSEGEGK